MYDLFVTAPVQSISAELLRQHALVGNNTQTHKSFSSGSIDQDCSSIMEGKLDSGDFETFNGKGDSFEGFPTSRYYVNLMEFNRKVSTCSVHPAVLLLENEISMEKSQLPKRVRKRSSSLSSLDLSGSQLGQWTPKSLDSGNTSLTGSCSSLQNIGNQAAFLQRFGGGAQRIVGNSSPDVYPRKNYDHFRIGPETAIQPIEVRQGISEWSRFMGQCMKLIIITKVLSFFTVKLLANMTGNSAFSLQLIHRRETPNKITNNNLSTNYWC